MYTHEDNTIELTRGDSHTIVACCDEHSFVPGDTVVFTVRRYVNAPDILLQKTITVFREGLVDITINPEDTSDLPFGHYVYDCEWTDAEGHVHTFIKDRFELTWEATY